MCESRAHHLQRSRNTAATLRPIFNTMAVPVLDIEIPWACPTPPPPRKLVRSFAIADFLLAAASLLSSLCLSLLRWSFFSSTVGEERERERNAQIQSKEGGRKEGRESMQVWRQVSHPVRSSLPLLFIRSHSVKRGREMEEEDMVRSRKPLSLSLPLARSPTGLARKEGRKANGGWRWHACECVVRACESARFWQCDDQRNKLRREGAMRRPSTDRVPLPSLIHRARKVRLGRPRKRERGKEKDGTAGNERR